MKHRLHTWMIERGGLLALATLVFYVWIAPAHVVNGDNAEFSTLGFTGGAAHPSGYPTYLLWLRLWSWLPAESPAHAAAIATCLCTALQALVMHAACRAWGARPTTAGIVTAILIAGPIVLRVQSEAEVFAPHHLICALILWLSARKGPLTGEARVAVLGLVAGLGIGIHLTCVLLAPVGLVGAVRGAREAKRGVAIAVVLGVAALVLGLSTYLYLLVTPDTWMSWGKVEDLRGLVRHFLRYDYGGPGAFAPTNETVTLRENEVALLLTLARSYLYVLPLIGVAALGVFSVRPDPTGETRVAWRVLTLSWLLAGPLLVAKFNVKLDDSGIYVVQRFHLTAVTLLAVPLAVGIDRLAAALLERRAHPLRAPLLAAVAPLIIFVALAARALPSMVQVHSRAMEQGLRNMLTTLPPDAVVFGSYDVFHFGLGYMQGALGMRRDVVVITTPQLGLAYARDRIHRRSGIDMSLEPGKTINITLCERALAIGRPVFIDAFQSAIAKEFPTYPFGVFFRVLPKGTPLPPVDALFAMNKALYEKYELGYPTPSIHDEVGANFHFLYTRTWQIIADALRATGPSEDFEYAVDMATALAPLP